MMNAIHSVTKYGWLMYNISIKDLIVNFSGPLLGTAQPTRFVAFSNSMYSNKFTQFEFLI